MTNPLDDSRQAVERLSDLIAGTHIGAGKLDDQLRSELGQIRMLIARQASYRILPVTAGIYVSRLRELPCNMTLTTQTCGQEPKDWEVTLEERDWERFNGLAVDGEGKKHDITFVRQSGERSILIIWSSD